MYYSIYATRGSINDEDLILDPKLGEDSSRKQKNNMQSEKKKYMH